MVLTYLVISRMIYGLLCDILANCDIVLMHLMPRLSLMIRKESLLLRDAVIGSTHIHSGCVVGWESDYLEMSREFLCNVPVVVFQIAYQLRISDSVDLLCLL